MAKSVYERLLSLDARNESSKIVEETIHIQSEVSAVDDSIREIYDELNDFHADFNDKTIGELRDFIEKLMFKVENVKKKLY